MRRGGKVVEEFHSHLALTILCSKKIIQALLKPYTAYLASENLDLQPGRVVSSISKAKSKEQSGFVFLEEAVRTERTIRQRNGLPLGDDVEEKKTIDRVIGEIFVEYEKTLKRNNALDFDDLLTYGVKLFTKNDETVIWCRHILVDELCVSALLLFSRPNLWISAKIRT